MKNNTKFTLAIFIWFLFLLSTLVWFTSNDIVNWCMRLIISTIGAFILILIVWNKPWRLLKNKNLSFIIGLILAVLHFFIVSCILIGTIGSTGQAGLLIIILPLLDIFLLPVDTLFVLSANIEILWWLPTNFLLFILHGVIGTLGWFFIPISVTQILKKFKNNL
ncbi:MAG: hypothetical protein JSV34_04575 [Candidatus Omnitrophota bacterium]|nr:MAG: hypothetical protein JSV34_04575 [Candidatus Omnitrophota bacterium]